MKKLYNDLEMQVILFCVADIVTLSENAKDDTSADIFD